MDEKNLDDEKLDLCLVVNKYSPKVNTNKVKAQINLVYDQYNGGNFFKTNNRYFWF